MVKEAFNRGALVATAFIGRFFAWWRSRLLEGLPLGVRRAFAEVHEECVVRLEADGAVLERRRLDAVTARRPLDSPGAIAAALGPGGGERRVRRIIQVSPEKVLSRTLEWPLQAESNLRNAISYQLENLVPLPADAIYFDYAVRRRRLDAGVVEFELVTVPREMVDPWIDALEESSGAGVDAVTVAGREAKLNLLPEQRRATARNRSGVWIALLSGVVVALVVVALVLPLYGKARELALIEDRVAKLTGKAESVRLLRQELADDVAAVQQVVVERRRLPSRVALLDVLAESLPDDTYLVALELKGNQLAIRGEAPSTVGIVEKLSAVEAFEQVDFGASVTRNSRTGKERFRLNLTVKEPDVADDA